MVEGEVFYWELVDLFARKFEHRSSPLAIIILQVQLKFGMSNPGKVFQPMNILRMPKKQIGRGCVIDNS